MHELTAELYLPEVFTYSWAGGSLAPAKTSRRTSFIHDIPTPGAKLSFQQVLIDATAPSVRINYAIDLNGHYFRE